MKKQIYGLIGDFYHDHDPRLEALKQSLKPFEDQVELHEIQTDDLPAALTKADLIFLDKENRVNPQDAEVRCWMTPEKEKQLVNYVSNGGNFLSWHASLASYDEGGEYIAMRRGVFKFHPKVNKPVKFTTKGNFFGKPLSFEVMDEHYFVEVDQANTDVFLLSESIDGGSVAGWKHTFGKGRVICYIPTHRKEGLTNPIMLEMLGDCIKWALGI